jgi:hypothetical protein
MMRLHGIAFVVLAACELQPAPPKRLPPAKPPAAAPAPVASAAPVDAGVAPIAVDAVPTAQQVESDPCVGVGIQIADVLIRDAKDPMQRAALEQERAQIVRRTEQA